MNANLEPFLKALRKGRAEVEARAAQYPHLFAVVDVNCGLTPMRTDGKSIALAGKRIYVTNRRDAASVAQNLTTRARGIGSSMTLTAMLVSEWAPKRIAALDEVIAKFEEIAKEEVAA